MIQFFQESKKLAPISGEDVLSIVAGVRLEAAANVGGDYYLPIIESELAEFLRVTKIDEYRWREANAKLKTPQLVCRTFSAIMWASLVQEQVKVGALYPWAAARVTCFRHSVCGFVNERNRWLFFEPQDDAILSVSDFALRFPGQDVQRFEFV